MSERSRIALFALALALVLGMMSWRTMHPEQTSAMHGLASYYINDDLPAEAIPGDGRPLTIAQGEFRYAQDGTVRFTHQGMPPTLFAQRQVNLLLKFAAMPKNPATTFAALDALMQEWDRQGTAVSALFLDYRPAKPDFKAFAAFIRALKKHFLQNPHILIPVVSPDWAEMPDHKLLLDDIPAVLVDLRQFPPTQVQSDRLSRFEYNFQLMLPATALPDDEIMDILPKPKTFGGYFLTLGPHHTRVRKEQAIGLFPKL